MNLNFLAVPFGRVPFGFFQDSLSRDISLVLREFWGGPKHVQFTDEFLHGILHLRNSNIGPNSGKQILDARILDPNSWVDFFNSVFFQQRGPQKNSPSRNSPPKIHLPKFKPEIGGKIFTLHLCRPIWLSSIKCENGTRNAKKGPKTT